MKNRKSIAKMTFCLLIATSVSCHLVNEEGPSHSSVDSVTSNDPSQNDFQSTEGKVRNQVTGYWDSGCKESAVEEASYIEAASVALRLEENGQFEWTFSIYDRSCRNLKEVIREQGRYQVKGKVKALSYDETQSDIDAYAIDYVTERVEVTPHQDEVVEMFNADKEAGFDDWQIGLSQNVTGRSYSLHRRSRNQVFYSCLRVTSDSQVIMGSLERNVLSNLEPDGSSVEKRVLRLDSRVLMPVRAPK